MAAMASPLLESGAIDGAKGILINITGSSSLKLNEVNEASTIIQNAAHEDANIIFGAVQDETMGDDVKITVIATGFKQQEMPARRERMLAEATLPTVRYEMPVEPRIPVSRPTTPRFLSEEMERTEPAVAAPQQRVAEPQMESRRDGAADHPAVAANPELVPVPASVFDDDFFRTSPQRTVASPGIEQPVRVEAGIHGTTFAVAQDNPPSSNPGVDAGVRSPFAAATVIQPDPSEPDELDIPAFLRRGN
jgi:cell division protein FtsZ